MKLLSARPFLALAAAAAAWTLVPVAVKSLLRASFFEFTAPIDVAASHVRDLQEFWSLRSHSKTELIEAGRDLARVTASYDLAVQSNAELKVELRRLERALNVPSLPNYRREEARVAQRDFSGWWQRLVLRKGADYRITVGSPVVFSGGVVGRIAEVHADTSVVEMISTPNFRVAAFFDGDDRPLSFQGGVNPAFGPARAIVEFAPLDIYAGPSAPPKWLVTSGLGGEFPAGLILGRVVKLERSADGLYQNGSVELDSRLSDLAEVTILVPQSSTEAAPPALVVPPASPGALRR